MRGGLKKLSSSWRRIGLGLRARQFLLHYYLPDQSFLGWTLLLQVVQAHGPGPKAPSIHDGQHVLQVS